MYFTSESCSAMCFEQAAGHAVRIRVEETNPFRLSGRDLRKSASRCDSPSFMPKIFAVCSGVLADEIDLANPLRKQAAGFRYHRFEPAASIRSPVLRNHAESTRMIATFRDLDIGVVPRRGQNARREVVIQVRLERRSNRNSRPGRALPLSPAHWCRSARRLPANPSECRRDIVPPGTRRRSVSSRGRSSCARPSPGWCRRTPAWQDR